MTIKYVASIQVSHTVGFWTPHTEYEYVEHPFDSMTQAMFWLANNRLAYQDNTEVAISLRADGTTLVLWEITRHETVTPTGRIRW